MSNPNKVPVQNISASPGEIRRVYFASDFHLGAEARLTSREREKLVVKWLNMVSEDAEAIYLVGDIFEFWFEYQSVVPKGFTRVLGKLAELRDRGIRIEVFTGNHDQWMFGYFEEELGIPVHYNPVTFTLNEKSFFIGHGDGLGPGDYGYKRMKKVFTHPISRWMFRWLHPDLGAKLALFFSRKSREATPPEERNWLGEPREWLLQYCKRKISKGVEPDYFIFGHRHLPVDWLLENGKSRYLNLGEWLWHNSYAVFDGSELSIYFFENDGAVVKNW
jgi:UDP-2,3-diacylglucosamine hydrolase